MKEPEENKTKIEINNTDIAIVVRRDGKAEAYIPMEDEISWGSIHGMLKKIRKLELVFTELVNKTHVGKDGVKDE